MPPKKYPKGFRNARIHSPSSPRKQKSPSPPRKQKSPGPGKKSPKPRRKPFT